MHPVDWLVVGLYLLGLMALAVYLGKRQVSRDDYFLGGNRMPAISLATSTIATQCSTNSLLGAPAFVGFVAGGGMLWLQYELAVPLAMLALMYLLGPLRGAGYISVYGFLEDRLGTGARRLASVTFLLFRGVATGVTVYGVALVLTLLLDIGYTTAVLVLMLATIVYDVIGGLRAVVWSDVLQTVLIVVAVAACLVVLLADVGGWAALFTERARAIDPSWGLTDGNSYGLWPMLIGGFFLYCAYYGCDQSQAQRVLAAASPEASRRVLFYNGVLRFPLVLLYCLLGLALAAYASQHTDFVGTLPRLADGGANYNLVFPVWVLQNFPAGAVGLVMVGIFAAAMSSIDSALNSLSAATVEDWIRPLRGARAPLTERQWFLASKLTTVGWGLFAVVFSYQVEAIAPTVLEAINKIGSMANGPLLALFVLALLAPGVGQRGAIFGFAAGLLANGFVWQALPQVSWLWWNLIGFVVAIVVALLLALPKQQPVLIAGGSAPIADGPRRSFRLGLLAMAAVILVVCLGLQRLAE